MSRLFMSQLRSRVAVLSFFVLLLASLSAAERVAVQANKSFCFFEDLKAGVPWGVQFQSDDHAIKTVLRSPVKVLFEGKPEAYGSYSIMTEVDGRYSVCFENPAATIQKVSFNFLGASAADPTKEGGRTMDPLENEIAQLIQNLRSIQNEQDYMMQREKMHARIAQRTNSRVRWWFLYQVALVAAAVVVEIFYLKSFFEKRRVV